MLHQYKHNTDTSATLMSIHQLVLALDDCCAVCTTSAYVQCSYHESTILQVPPCFSFLGVFSANCIASANISKQQWYYGSVGMLTTSGCTIDRHARVKNFILSTNGSAGKGQYVLRTLMLRDTMQCPLSWDCLPLCLISRFLVLSVSV